MVKNIARVTNDAKLNGNQDYEKFQAIERTADGTLVVRSLGALGGQGGEITDLINENTVAVLHNHPCVSNKDGYLIQTPTLYGDSSSLRLRNIPGYMFSDKTNTLYEIFRQDGKLKYAKVKNDLSLSKGIVF